MIFLHGLGDSARGFADVFMDGMCPANCRVVLPTAPTQAVSCNGGMEMASWFDIFELTPRTIPDLKQIRSMLNQDDVTTSVKLLNDLIDQELKTLPNQDLSRIFIGGFSQGAMVSLATLMTWKRSKPLGGVVALSGFQVVNEDPSNMNVDAIKNTPLFSYHGQQDQVLPVANAENTFSYLRDQIYTGEYAKNYSYTSERGLAHSLS